MSNQSIVVVLVLIALSIFFMFDSADAHCRRHDRHCCRRRIDHGRCHNHHRRWAFNVTCGRCVEFDYSGCGGDENNFERFEECNNCCGGTIACPKYTLSKPPHECEYKWEESADRCPRPRLECHRCQPEICRPDSCRTGERCIAEAPRPCHQCPCKQFRCQSDPCFAIQRQLRPCERCVAVPAPICETSPCPLVAHREDHCHVPHHEPRRCPPVVPCQQSCRTCVIERNADQCPQHRCASFD